MKKYLLSVALGSLAVVSSFAVVGRNPGTVPIQALTLVAESDLPDSSSLKLAKTEWAFYGYHNYANTDGRRIYSGEPRLGDLALLPRPTLAN